MPKVSSPSISIKYTVSRIVPVYYRQISVYPARDGKRGRLANSFLFNIDHNKPYYEIYLKNISSDKNNRSYVNLEVFLEEHNIHVIRVEDPLTGVQW